MMTFCRCIVASNVSLFVASSLRLVRDEPRTCLRVFQVTSDTNGFVKVVDSSKVNNKNKHHPFSVRNLSARNHSIDVHWFPLLLLHQLLTKPVLSRWRIRETDWRIHTEACDSDPVRDNRICTCLQKLYLYKNYIDEIN